MYFWFNVELVEEVIVIFDLLKIIDSDGKEILKYKYVPLRVHLEGYTKFATKFNMPISLTSNEAAALGLIRRGYVVIENLIVAYNTIGSILYLPLKLDSAQINYIEKNIPYFQKLEKNNKVFNVGIYSEEPLYYNNKKYRDLSMEANIESAGGTKVLVSDLLGEELTKQKGKKGLLRN